MRIKLKWTNRNNKPVTTNIYRNETDVANNQLGEPIATVPDGTTEYMDETAVFGKTYYYVFETVGGGQNLFSKSLKILATYSNGPGPQALISGDQQLGYFGQVNALEFFTQPEVTATIGYASYIGTVPMPAWDKWIRNGKILYIPRSSLFPSTTWQMLYTKGVVFGTDDTGPAWAPTLLNLPGVNQRTILEKGFFRFIVRLPTAYDDRNNPTKVVPDLALPKDRKFSEVADVYYPGLNTWVPESQRFPRIGPSVPLGTANENRDLHGQEKFKTGIACAFNASSNTSGYSQGIFNVLATNASIGWRPVLELIQEDFVIGSTEL